MVKKKNTNAIGVTFKPWWIFLHWPKQDIHLIVAMLCFNFLSNYNYTVVLSSFKINYMNDYDNRDSYVIVTHHDLH